jgi:hypothetical protein
VTRDVTFLLVEDDPNDVVMLEMEFRRVPAHIRMMAVGDGKEAMQYLEGDGKFRDEEKYSAPNLQRIFVSFPWWLCRLQLSGKTWTAPML